MHSVTHGTTDGVLRRRERPNLTPYFLIAPNFVWLLLFMAGALVLLAITSLRGYEPGGRGILETWELTHYSQFLGDPFFLGVLWRSLVISTETTIICLILGFPLAYWLSQLRGTARAVLYLAVLMPLLTSAVVRTFGWMILLSNNGFLNKTLINLGITEQPDPADVQMRRESSSRSPRCCCRSWCSPSTRRCSTSTGSSTMPRAISGPAPCASSSR